jgi:hypothetical protein
MISAELMRSDEFLALPGESQLLYVHLLVEADDDGFLLGKNRIVTMLGLDEAAFHALTEAGFVMQFPSGAAVIMHWPVCNAIRKDRHTPTKYRAELAQLETVPEVGYVLKQETPAVQKEEPIVQKEASIAAEYEAVVQKEAPIAAEYETVVQKEGAPVQNQHADVQNTSPDVQREISIVQKEPSDEIKKEPAGSETPVFTACAAPAEQENTEPPAVAAEETVPEKQNDCLPAQEFCPYAPPLPLQEGGEYRLLQKDVDVLRRKFTGMNITEELKKLRKYLENNPGRRKTADEMGEGVENWFVYEQKNAAPKSGKKKHLPDESPPSYDIDLAEYLMNTRVPKLRKKEK